MRLSPVIPAAILAVSAAPATASPDHIPYLCGGPDVHDRNGDGGAPAARALVGTYRCEENGITVTLRLDADGGFEERMEGEGVRAAGDVAMPAKPDILTGRWRIEGPILRLFERPAHTPFRERGRAADARGDAVIVPFGITGAVLRRIAPGR